jgi:pyruvate, water dikinase
MSSSLAKIFRIQKTVNLKELKVVFENFKQILEGNNNALDLISQMEDLLSGEYVFDINFIIKITHQLSEEVYKVIRNINDISNNKYSELLRRYEQIRNQIELIISRQPNSAEFKNCVTYNDINSLDLEMVGAKNANLGEVRNYLNLFTPSGFIITTHAYNTLMEQKNLWQEIKTLYQRCFVDKKQTVIEYDKAIDELFSSISLPVEIEQSIKMNLRAIRTDFKNKKLRLAIRSSAYGEDEEKLSFAGQFDSVLNCPPEKVFDAYFSVVASRFKSRTILYNTEYALDRKVLPMAVGVQELVPAKTSGVVYTVDPNEEIADDLLISAKFGFGADLVSGISDADVYKVSRLDTSKYTIKNIAQKRTQLTSSDIGGLNESPLDIQYAETACLSTGQIAEISETALLLDRYFKRPLDIEWCFDEDGRLFILQCRPLTIKRKTSVTTENLKKILSNKKILLNKEGQVAQRGIAAGKVHHVREGDDLLAFPPGAIAVTNFTTPRLSGIIRKAKAIITDTGSSTGHMATVAREFGVPLIVNTNLATSVLAEGAEITVDAEDNIIYEGIIKELLSYNSEAEDVFRELKEYRMIRQILLRISPLLLIDIKSKLFSAKNCRTYHDILRFCHEKAVKELINLNMSSNQLKGIKTKKIQLPIPLGLSIIDLGGGLENDPSAKLIESLNQVRSIPMLSVLKGLTSPGVWTTQPVQLGFGDLISSMTRYSVMERTEKSSGQNLAVISEKYMNLSLRLGYHFNVVDSYISDNINDNYIYFRFVGGVTETGRRHLRALLIKNILDRLNFKVQVKGDLVTARIKKWESEKILQILEQIGRLIGFSRQLDTQMQNNDSVQTYLNKFFNKNLN